MTNKSTAPASKPPARSAIRLSWKRKLLYAGAMLALVFGGIELALRALITGIAWNAAEFVWDGGTDLKPDKTEWPETYPKNARGRHVYIEFDVPVSFNSDGFRAPEFNPSNGPVVIVLGDSTSAGHGIVYEKMFSSLLQDDLRKRCGPSAPDKPAAQARGSINPHEAPANGPHPGAPGQASAIQVWNLARAGTGTIAQTRLLEHILNKYPTADVRIVVFVTTASIQAAAGNDLVDLLDELPHLDGVETSATSNMSSHSSSGSPAPKRTSSSIQRFKNVIRQCAVLHAGECLLSRWRRLNVHMPRMTEWDAAWNGFNQAMQRARAACDTRGVRIVVAQLAIYPSDTPEEIEEVSRRFHDFLDPHDIAFVRLAPQLTDLRDKAWFLPIDGHPSELGHRYYADELLPVIARLLGCP